MAVENVKNNAIPVSFPQRAALGLYAPREYNENDDEIAGVEVDDSGENIEIPEDTASLIRTVNGVSLQRRYSRRS
ncbi:MAG: hypothetical protein MJ102_02695 [Clostridia bacterium]|nr:hypothetical protein [Clostridia bacterium]